MAHPDMAAPDIEKYIAMPDITQMFGAGGKAMLLHQNTRHLDILRAHMILADRLMRGKHVPAAKQLDLILVRPCTGIPNSLQHQLQRLIRVASIQRTMFFPRMLRQHVMAHATHQQAGMPHSNCHTGAEQRADTRIAFTEIHLARLQENLDGVRGFMHQVFST